MNNTFFHKTLIAVILSGVCASTLSADLSAQGSSSTSSQNSVAVNNAATGLGASNNNQAAIAASVDESAAERARNNTAASVREGIALGKQSAAHTSSETNRIGGTVAFEAEQNTQSDNALTVDTLDGIAIDLSSDNQNATAAQISTTVNATVEQAMESSAGVSASITAATHSILDNTATSARDLSGAADFSASVDSASDATADVQVPEETFDAAESANIDSDGSTSATGSLVGGLL